MELIKAHEILIVDDSPTTLSILKQMFSKEPYRISEAGTGEEAISKALRTFPDLILLDLNLPDIDGIEICKILKDNALTRDIPILFITGERNTKKLCEAFNAGALDYIIKPFDLMEIGARVKTHLQLMDLIQRHKKLISDLKEANERIDSLSKMDMLTGLYNRRGIEEKFKMELSRTKRFESPFSIFLGDLDGFKNINDSFGHNLGDNVLQEIALLLKENSRGYDCIGRWGGEEFIGLLPGTDCDGARKVAESIRSKVERHAVSRDNEKIQITMSFGLSSLKPDMQFSELIEVADRNLYQAKRSGKNIVVG